MSYPSDKRIRGESADVREIGMKSYVEYSTVDEFNIGIIYFVQHGIGFVADATTLRITFTGSF